MLQRGAVLTGVGIGAGLMYFLDPERGRRRRALVRDQLTHAAHVSGQAMDATRRDVLHRTMGLSSRLRRRAARPTDDYVLVERVRARMGRVVSHPHALDIDATDGIVTLRGPILQSEVNRLLTAVARVRGVREVVSELQEHKESDSVPALQGGDRSELRRRQWSPARRLVTGSAGVAIAGYGASRRDTPGALLAAAGIGLAARAVTNRDLGQLTGVGGGSHGVDVQKTITIDAPVEEVFAFWSEYSNFPRFLSRVLDVRPANGNARSRWTVAGPGGVPVEFDAEVSALVPNRALGWRTVHGSPVTHAGLVRFDPAGPGRTRVQVRMSYNPPGGWIGHGVAAAFGADPKRSLDADMARMKTLLETGRVPRDAARPSTS